MILDNVLLCRGSSQLYYSQEYNTVTDCNSSSERRIVYCVLCIFRNRIESLVGESEQSEFLTVATFVM